MSQYLDTTWLSRVSRENFLPVLEDNVFNGMPTLKVMLMNNRVKPYTGTELSWNTPIKKHGAKGLFKGYSPIVTQPNNILVPATLTNANYYATISISLEEKLLNEAGQAGKDKLLDGLKVQFESAEETMHDDIGSAIFGDGSLINGLSTIVGFESAIAIANTYANIDRSTAANAQWRANQDIVTYTDHELTDQTVSSYLPHLMRRMQKSCTHKKQPDLIDTTKALYTLYEDICEGKLQYDNTIANLGFGGAKLGNVKMIFDDQCTSLAMYFLTLDTWNFFVVPGAKFDFVDKNGTIWQYGESQLAMFAVIILMGQLRCGQPRVNGKLTNKGDG